MSWRSSSPRIAIAAVVLLASPALAGAQQSPMAWSASDTTFTAEEALADFDQLRAAVEEAHGGLYRYSPKPTLDRAFDSLRARLTGPVSRRGLTSIVAEMI